MATVAAPAWNEERRCWVVKETEHYFVELIPMIYNVRLALTSRANPNGGYSVEWCYAKEDSVLAMAAALEFDPETQTEPTGPVIKRVGRAHVPPGKMG